MLLRFYERALKTYKTTVEALVAAQATTLARREYERLMRFVQQAQAKANQARNELDRHRVEHGCYPLTHSAKAKNRLPQAVLTG
jgi:hypothetical protein